MSVRMVSLVEYGGEREVNTSPVISKINRWIDSWKNRNK